MRKKTIKEIKHILDVMLIPAWKEEIPIGYECNEKTWSGVDEFLPKVRVNYCMPSSHFASTFINVREGVADGFHPVYVYPTDTSGLIKNRKSR